MATTYYTVEYGGASYGYSRLRSDAEAALERGLARGVRSARIAERASPLRGARANEWMSPFDERKAGFR